MHKWLPDYSVQNVGVQVKGAFVSVEDNLEIGRVLSLRYPLAKAGLSEGLTAYQSIDLKGLICLNKMGKLQTHHELLTYS